MIAADRLPQDDGRRAGLGWLAFAGTVLIISGGFKILDALWAFKYDDEVSEEIQTVLFEHDPAAWGWLWLFIGFGLLASGIAVVGGAQWARWFGVVAAGVAMVVNYGWIFVQPVWTLVTQGVLLAVIFALLVYGGRSTDGTHP